MCSMHKTILTIATTDNIQSGYTWSTGHLTVTGANIIPVRAMTCANFLRSFDLYSFHGSFYSHYVSNELATNCYGAL